MADYGLNDMGMPQAPPEPRDEVLEMVQRARRAEQLEKLRAAGFAPPSMPEPLSLGQFVAQEGPGAVAGAIPGGRLARMLMMGAGIGGAGAIAATPTEAGNGSELDPRLQKIKDLDTEIAGHRNKLETMAKTNFQSKTARENASQPFLSAISQAEQRKAALEGELDAEAKKKAQSSFSHTMANSVWPGVQWGGPVVASMLTKGAGNMAERALNKPWRRAVDGAEAALGKSGQDEKFAYNVAKAEEHLKLEPQGMVGRGARKMSDVMRDTVIPTAAGAGVGMEAALFPHQYNRRNAPEGSPERLEAEKALGENFANTAIQGLAPGILGGFTGAHLPNIGPGYRPEAETRALSRFLSQPSSPGPAAPSPPGSPGPAPALQGGPRPPAAPSPGVYPPPPAPQGALPPLQVLPPARAAAPNQPALSRTLKEPLVERMQAGREAVAAPEALPPPPRGAQWVPEGKGSKLQDKKTKRFLKMPEE
jgi:hypothetical protein